MTSFYAEINGVKVHYMKVGRGPNILLLIPGLLGWGQSRSVEREFVDDIYQKDADLVMALMDNLGYKKYSLLGWSYGSLVSFAIVYEKKDCIQRLITVGGMGWLCEKVILAGMTPSRYMQHGELNIMFDAYGRAEAEKLWDENAKKWVAARARGELNWDFREIIREFKCPTLVIHGDCDILVGKHHANLIGQMIPNFRVALIPEVSHQPQMESPYEFNKILTDFFMEQI